MPPSQKVFGIGLSRTGTTSLTEALRMLGYRAAHFPLGILRLENGELKLNTNVAARFDALTDTPVARMFRELDAAFPSSKFILTVRDPQAWVKSMRRLRASYFFLHLLPKVARLTRDLYGEHAYTEKQTLLESYARHHAAVEAYFGNRLGRDLLIFDVHAPDAWTKLSSFLGRPVPKVPFPHRNRGYTTTLRNALDFSGYF